MRRLLTPLFNRVAPRRASGPEPPAARAGGHAKSAIARCLFAVQQRAHLGRGGCRREYMRWVRRPHVVGVGGSRDRGCLVRGTGAWPALVVGGSRAGPRGAAGRRRATLRGARATVTRDGGRVGRPDGCRSDVRCPGRRPAPDLASRDGADHSTGFCARAHALGTDMRDVARLVLASPAPYGQVRGAWGMASGWVRAGESASEPLALTRCDRAARLNREHRSLAPSGELFQVSEPDGCWFGQGVAFLDGARRAGCGRRFRAAGRAGLVRLRDEPAGGVSGVSGPKASVGGLEDDTDRRPPDAEEPSFCGAWLLFRVISAGGFGAGAGDGWARQADSFRRRSGSVMTWENADRVGGGRLPTCC